MFKNKNYIVVINFIKKILTPKMYAIYITANFAKTFLIWFIAFFAVLFAIKHLDSNDKYTLSQNLIIDCYRAGSVLCDNINIIILISCIFFIIKMKNNFNFQILETFSLTSTKILFPMIIFLIFISTIKIFVLQPLIVDLENKKIAIINNNSLQDNLILKEGTTFNIIQGDNKNDFFIISGTYKEHTKEHLISTNTVVLQYENQNLIKSFVSQNAILTKNQWLLQKVNILNLINKYAKIEFADNYIIESNVKPNEIAIKIKNTEKLLKSLQLNLYDHIKLIKQNKHNDAKIQNEIDAKARVYITNEIVSLFLSFLCCLLSFLFCVSNLRNANIAKLSLKCFIVYFIILRIFHSLENITKISIYGSYCVIALSVIMCYIVYFFIINKDWCEQYTNIFKQHFKAIKAQIYLIIKIYFCKFIKK